MSLPIITRWGTGSWHAADSVLVITGVSSHESQQAHNRQNGPTPAAAESSSAFTSNQHQIIDKQQSNTIVPSSAAMHSPLVFVVVGLAVEKFPDGARVILHDGRMIQTLFHCDAALVSIEPKVPVNGAVEATR